MIPFMGPPQLYTLITSILIFTYYQGPPNPSATITFTPMNLYFASTIVEDSFHRLPGLKEVILVAPAGHDVNKLGRHMKRYMRKAHVRLWPQTPSKQAIRSGSGDEALGNRATSGPQKPKHLWGFMKGNFKEPKIIELRLLELQVETPQSFQPEPKPGLIVGSS